MARFVSEIGTGPIGRENGASMQVMAAITPINAICLTSKDDFVFSVVVYIFSFLSCFLGLRQNVQDNPVLQGKYFLFPMSYMIILEKQKMSTKKLKRFTYKMKN